MKIYDARVVETRTVQGRGIQYQPAILEVFIDEWIDWSRSTPTMHEGASGYADFIWEIRQIGPFVQMSARLRDDSLALPSIGEFNDQRFLAAPVVPVIETERPATKTRQSYLLIDRARHYLKKFAPGWRYELDEAKVLDNEMISYRLLQEHPTCKAIAGRQLCGLPAAGMRASDSSVTPIPLCQQHLIQVNLRNKARRVGRKNPVNYLRDGENK